MFAGPVSLRDTSFNYISVDNDVIHKVLEHNLSKDQLENLIVKNTNLIDVRKEGKTPLHQACLKGRYDIVEVLLKYHANPSIQDEDGRNALHMAAEKGSADIIKLLMEKGCDPNARDKEGYSPLFIACEAGHDAAVKALVLGVEVDGKKVCSTIDAKNGPENWTALHVAATNCCPSIIRFLMENGLDPNATNDNDETPLLWACQAGKAETARALIEGVTVNGKKVCTRLDCTIEGDNDYLFSAAFHGFPEVIRLLLEKGLNPNVKTQEGASSLYIACAKGHVKAAEALLDGVMVNGARVCAIVDDKNAKDERTALHGAANEGSASVIPLLISRGFDPNARTKDGITPLFLACQRGHKDAVEALLNGVVIRGEKVCSRIGEKNGRDERTELHTAAEFGKAGIIQLLLSWGADPNVKTALGKSPLFLACRYGFKLAAKALIDGVVVGDKRVCARIDDKDADEGTLLHVAVERGHTDLILLLLKKGLDPSIKDKNGLTPLYRACEFGHDDVVTALLDGVGIDHKKVSSRLEEKNGEEELTALHAAAIFDRDSTIRLLLSRGANPQARTTSGRTPLSYACGKGFIYTVAALLEGEDCKGQRVCASANDIKALHDAVFAGHATIIRLLLTEGADPNARREDGCTPLYIACQNGHKEAAIALIYGVNMEGKKICARLDDKVKNGENELTALDVALLSKATDIAGFLIYNGAPYVSKSVLPTVHPDTLMAAHKEHLRLCTRKLGDLTPQRLKRLFVCLKYQTYLEKNFPKRNDLITDELLQILEALIQRQEEQLSEANRELSKTEAHKGLSKVMISLTDQYMLYTVLENSKLAYTFSERTTTKCMEILFSPLLMQAIKQHYTHAEVCLKQAKQDSDMVVVNQTSTVIASSLEKLKNLYKFVLKEGICLSYCVELNGLKFQYEQLASKSAFGKVPKAAAPSSN